MSKHGLCIAVLVGMGGTAHAQAPGQTDAPPEVEIEDAPAPDAAPPPAPSPYDRCMAERQTIAAQASDETKIKERTRLYQSMPECHRDPAAPAQAVVPPPQPVEAPSMQSAELLPSEIPELRSPATATLLSISTTAIGYGLVFGLHREPQLETVGAVLTFIGPTTGHIYAGRFWSAGLGVRLLGTGVGLLGGFVAFSSQGHDPTTAIGLLGTGALLYLGGSVYDIATAPHAVRDYNRKKAQLGLAPIASPHAGGVSLVGSF